MCKGDGYINASSANSRIFNQSIYCIHKDTIMNRLVQHFMKQSYVFVFVLFFIHKYAEAAVLFTKATLLKDNARYDALNSTSSSLDESMLTTFRYKRSGGFPKIPMQEKSTYFTSRECGTRVVHFDPLRKGKIVGGTSVSSSINYSVTK